MMSRIVISGLAGGGGKTLLTLGLCRALANDGLRIKPFKKGPDYIDAAWLARAARGVCSNLDPFFLDEDRLRALFGHNMRHADMAVIEGNRGLFDGRDAAGSCSTAAVARTLDAPVVLVINCTKMTRTAAAVAVGMAGFEPYRLAGVVLNQVGTARHGALVRQCIENAGIRVLGALPRLRKNPIPERHMGLVCMDGSTEKGREASDETAEGILEYLANFVRENVDLAAVREAGNLPSLACEPFWPETVHTEEAAKARIGFVRDAVLWFYYPENLEALERAGAELVPVSLLDDGPWPPLDGLYLGGGFPELYARELAGSARVRDLADLCAAGLPVYAECGGFMVLCREISVKGEKFPMAGVFPTRAVFESHPQGLGYVEARVERGNPFHPTGCVFRGHEFHYSRCEMLEALPTDWHLSGGVGMGHGRDGLSSGATFAAYTHLFAPVVPHWAENFVRTAERFAGRTG